MGPPRPPHDAAPALPRVRTGVPAVTARDKALAVALRSMQWKLDEAAFTAGAQGLSRCECTELLNGLGNLAITLATYADKTPQTVSPEEAT